MLSIIHMVIILKYGQMIVIIGNSMFTERNNFMITLFRMIKLWKLKTKWQLALYQFLDKQLMDVIKDPESIEKKIMPYLAEVIHNSAEKK